MTDNEIHKVTRGFSLQALDSPDGKLKLARAVIAAYNAKLLAGVEMPEPASREFQAREGTWHPFLDEDHYLNTKEDGTWPIRDLFTKDQLQAAAAQARMKALDECLEICNRFTDRNMHPADCAAAIEKLKVKP